MSTWETMWEFETDRFHIVADIQPEEANPADSFDDAADIQAIRDGNVDWFCVRVRVLDRITGNELGGDRLGGCAYTYVREFFTSHRDPDPLNRNCSIMRAARGDNVVICHYFPDMVLAAIREARKYVADWPDPPMLRASALGNVEA